MDKSEKDIDKFFDIDYFIKLYSNQLKLEKHKLDEKINLSEGEEVKGILRCKDRYMLETHVFPKVDSENNSKICLLF